LELHNRCTQPSIVPTQEGPDHNPSREAFFCEIKVASLFIYLKDDGRHVHHDPIEKDR
jgi:hypothetical protein